MSQCYKKSLCFSQWQVINLSEPREELRRLNVRVKSTIQKVWLQDIFITCSLHGHMSLTFICVLSQVLDVGWPGQHAPSLHLLCSICKSIENWLNTHSEHALLLHCRVNTQPSTFLFPSHPSLTDLVPTSIFRSYH